LVDTLNDSLGPEPIEVLQSRTGNWTLRFLLATLACTPLKLLFQWKAQMRFRRMLGLFAFFYASVHCLVYLVLDLSLSWQQIVDEVPQSPHVMIGLLAFILLIPLALTSTQSMARRLGYRWKKLHSLIYLAGCLGIMHFFMLVKADIWEPLLYGSLLAFLLAIRIELDAMPSKKILRTQILIALTIAALNQILTISA
jgi:sulfoxide reductase heme-binding subunit YedZ